MELVDPRGRRPQLQAALAPRPRARDLRRIGFLSNEDEYMEGSLHFPRYTRILAKVFRERLGVTEFQWETKPLLSRAAEQEQIDRFRGWDAVVNGLAK